jgi:hypothetical protein
MAFVLVPSRQLTANRLGVTGNVERVVRERGLIAVVSYMSWLSIGGQIVSFGQLSQHIVVADERSERQLGSFDRCQYPVRDLAFHPTAPELAVATGVYGGQMDQNDGHLLIWNWETGAWRSVFSEERTIERVEYRDGGRRLADCRCGRTSSTSRKRAGCSTTLRSWSSRGSRTAGSRRRDVRARRRHAVGARRGDRRRAASGPAQDE